MSPDILITVAVTTVIQSIFGVGVLLFGTPLLLILGYDFVQALYILLPISMTINLFQIVRHYEHIDTDFYTNILVYTIPFVVVFLFIVSSASINIGIVIGVFLLLVALKNYSPEVEQAVESLVEYEALYLVVMGIIHGMTNLGGSLLTAIVHSKNYEKHQTRVTIAIAYATFALFQLLTLWFGAASSEIIYSEIGIYWGFALMTYVFSEETFYVALDNEKYTKIFALFLFVSGILLIGKSI